MTRLMEDVGAGRLNLVELPDRRAARQVLVAVLGWCHGCRHRTYLLLSLSLGSVDRSARNKPHASPGGAACRPDGRRAARSMWLSATLRGNTSRCRQMDGIEPSLGGLVLREWPAPLAPQPSHEAHRQA